MVKWISVLWVGTKAFQFAIRIHSIRFVMRIDSFSKKSAFRFTSVMQFFFLFIYCIVSAKKNKLTSLFAAFNTLDVFNLLEIVY